MSLRTSVRSASTLAIAAATCLNAQPAPSPPHGSGNASWTRAFAAPYTPDRHAGIGRANALLMDPRLKPLLTTSFPQHQWFWYEHARLLPTSGLIQIFLGVPGDTVLDDDRYVTTDGCVPHVCDTNRGMLWIDTSVRPSTQIFAATNIVGGDGNIGEHLWIFTSSNTDAGHLPPPFLASFHRWLGTIAQPGYNQTSGYRFRFVLVTVVAPSGIQTDLSPATLHLETTATGAKP